MSINVRAKFRVETQLIYDTGAEITMKAISDDFTEENRKFTQYTPNGSFKMYTNNKSVIEEMQPGNTYYLDFTRC